MNFTSRCLRLPPFFICPHQLVQLFHYCTTACLLLVSLVSPYSGWILLFCWGVQLSVPSIHHLSSALLPSRSKHKTTDVPDGGPVKQSFHSKDTSSTHTIVSSLQCEIKNSRLPTLPEEETPELRTTDPFEVVTEEVNGKDDTEVTGS